MKQISTKCAPQMKNTKEIPEMLGEYATLFLVELLNRALLEKKADPLQPDEIQPSHIERVIPQMMMDFF